MSDCDLDWHDGNLVDIRISGCADGARELKLLLDLREAAGKRRYECTGADLRRFILSGDIARLTKNSGSGNIDLARMDFTGDTEILVLSLFGGAIEAEAGMFQLTEVPK